MTHIYAALGISPSAYSRARTELSLIDKYGEAASVRERLEQRDGTHKGSTALLEFLEEQKPSSSASAPASASQ
jgi:hypothetical protein